MLISHSKKFIFAHVPRTGGTSITYSLRKYSAIEFDTPDPFEIKKIYAKSGFKFHDKLQNIAPHYLDYFKFAFVRNPYSRAISAYLYIRKTERSVQHRRLKNLTFKQFLLEQYSNYIIYKTKGLQILAPQYDFLHSCNGDMLADYVGRYENINEDYNYICRRLKITDTVLPHLNHSNNFGLGEYYDAATVSIINDMFKVDFETFGYNMQ